MTEEDDEAHPSRDKLRSEMLKAGWPSADVYTKGISSYGDKQDAMIVWELFLDEVADLGLMNYIARDVLIRLGPLARVSVPRALNLIGFIPSEEGGDVVIPELPDYGQWPVLSVDPETGG